MSGLRLTLRDAPAQRIDASALTPMALAGLSADAIRRIELPSGNRRLAVGDLFQVEGEAGGELLISGANGRLDFLGARMDAGSLVVEGDAGHYAGLGLKNANITIRGSAGAYAGCGMRSGLLVVEGDAGDHAGAGLPGDPKGMQGGILLIRGNAGHRAGDRMRRGALLVEGDAGDCTGSRMIAGTVAVLGRAGADAGLAMRRGTVLLAAEPASITATFNDCGTHPFGFLPLLFRAWRGLPGRFGALAPVARARRLMGDVALGGKGEILLTGPL